MKQSFFGALCELAAHDGNIEFIKADAGFNAKYQNGYPNQYLNIGISEQNMIGVAAGMALEGKTVFAYSLVDFTSLRVLDQIRVDMGYSNTNVKAVSCGTGFDYCDDGVSHIAVDDISALRAIPNLILFSPCDPHEAFAVTKAAAEVNGPCFIRLGRGGEPYLHAVSIENYAMGKAIPFFEGTDAAIFVTGSIAKEALEAAGTLLREGYSVGVYSFPTIKPIDSVLIKEKAKTVKLIVTVEEHVLAGGFGAAVAEILAEIYGRTAAFKRIGLSEEYHNAMALHSEKELEKLYRDYTPPAYMRRQSGITVEAITSLVRIGIREAQP